jgi:hypothetical protein
MIETMESARHATDGDLIRLLDDEFATADAELGSHVRECAECSARLARLRSHSQLISDAIRGLDIPPVDAARIRPPFDQVGIARLRRRRRAIALWSRPGLRAAAAIVLLAGVAAASPAVRRWVAERVAQRRESRPVQPAAPDRPSDAPQSSAGSRVWFAPTSSELVVRFQARPTSGTLALQAVDDDRASAQVVARAGGEELLILPGEVRVRNSTTSTAEYRITLPATVRRVRIHVGPADSQPVLIDVTPALARSITLAPIPRSR